MIELASKNEGKREMIPWIGTAAVTATIFTVVTINLINYFKTKNNNKNEIEIAKKEIINGIKEYDATNDKLEEENSDGQKK